MRLYMYLFYTVMLTIFEPGISHRRNALFGHVARLPDDVPAHKALNCHINLLLGRPPSSQWRRRPGRPRSRWVNQLRTDNNLPPADLWRRAVNRGHRGRRYGPCRLSDNNNNDNLLRVTNGSKAFLMCVQWSRVDSGAL